MEQEILRKLEENQQKLEEVYRSVERARKYFLWTLIITAVVIILPLIGLVFVLPSFLSSYNPASLGF